MKHYSKKIGSQRFTVCTATAYCLIFFVGETGFERQRPTVCDSLVPNQMRYLSFLFQSCRGDRIRTCDPLVPNQMRYRAAPLPEYFLSTLRKTLFCERSETAVEEAGFEPAVPLRVRQFSKLLVSATHPSLRSSVVRECKYSWSVFRKANISEKKLHQKPEMPIFGKV